jgi:hypothetical protein
MRTGRNTPSTARFTREKENKPIAVPPRMNSFVKAQREAKPQKQTELI